MGSRKTTSSSDETLAERARFLATTLSALAAEAAFSAFTCCTVGGGALSPAGAGDRAQGRIFCDFTLLAALGSALGGGMALYVGRSSGSWVLGRAATLPTNGGLHGGGGGRAFCAGSDWAVLHGGGPGGGGALSSHSAALD